MPGREMTDDAAPDKLIVFVAGDPAPQGSKRYVGRGIMIESSSRVKPWRADVRAALLGEDGRPLGSFGKVAIDLVLGFIIPRPKSLPKRRTPEATKRPDIDKLARAVNDAITSAGIWHDDSQIVRCLKWKRYADQDETPGCWIKISRYVDDEPCPPDQYQNTTMFTA